MKHVMEQKNGKNFIAKIFIVLFALCAVAASLLFVQKQESEKLAKLNSPEMLKEKTYAKLDESDTIVDNCEYIKFSAFFPRDIDGDGKAEKILGNCSDISEEPELYIDINVLSKGYLKNGKISVNGANFNYSMSMIKDSILKYNYISGNVKSIELNDVNAGTEKLLIGRIVANLKNNVNNYTSDATVTLTGTYVDEEGNETPISKKYKLNIDWYNEPVAVFGNTSTGSQFEFYTSKMTSNTLEFSVGENKKLKMFY